MKIYEEEEDTMPHTPPVPSQTAYEQFVESHKTQLEFVPKHLWKRLHEKLDKEIYDAGNAFQIMKHVIVDEDEEDDESNYTWKVITTDPDGVSLDDPNQIYLIDHAWTYRLNTAKQQLLEYDNMLQRMANMMDIDDEGKSKNDLVDEVLDKMWCYNQTYTLGGNDAQSLPIWYIMDEFGVKIAHSDDPTVKVVPFYYASQNISFSIMWPLKPLDEGVTRDYVGSHITDTVLRKTKLLPWKFHNFSDGSIDHVDFSDEFFAAHNVDESLPVMDADRVVFSRDRSVHVYSDDENLKAHLTDDRFELVDDPADADVMWFSKHYKNFRTLSEKYPKKIISQFPNEIVLTIKDLMAITAFRSPGHNANTIEHFGPKWLPVTYNLQKELPQLVTYFIKRQTRRLDNHWICKPWNMARSMDIHITNNLNELIRMTESGPKVACKYIHDPVLFHRPEVGDVKFDIRYVVLLSSVSPLVVHVYKIFWLRFANKPFSLDSFEDYEKHFTVMNYAEEAQLKQIHYDEFIPMFESQYPDFSWEKIEESIFDMIRQLFESASSVEPPQGLCPYPQSRAMYAVDLMLQWDQDSKGEKIIQPMMCEVNFSPDCERACKYHPFFFNDVLSTLILGQESNVVPLF
ncbi:tubulin--tyrosine ligase-like protein 12 isoform X2 [Tubulanus polymorphus]|uniref:tubulin--tyrosine ligase-like protein 12 isoform X2 n=1 Tax=Tubulanus polymorphus TaxID=672921 RepID=UPI003DA690B8